MNFVSASEDKFVASRSLHVWNTVESLSYNCPETHSKLFIEVNVVLPLLNLTFFVLPIFSAPVQVKRELNS